MAENERKHGLVLHIVGSTQPIQVAVNEDTATFLESQLPELLAVGEARTLNTADGGQFVVNFRHVATAHLEPIRADTRAYGNVNQPAGFSVS